LFSKKVVATSFAAAALGVAALILPFTVNAAGPDDYRFPREPGTTKDGYPLPLAG
jgi:hypothetical protein